MKFFNHYKTIVISDIPLGASADHFKKLIFFIKNTSCDKLILTGDIIKGWQSNNIGKLYKVHNKFLKTLLKVSERDNTEIIFVTGKEWSYKENIGTFKFSQFSFVKKYRLRSGGNNFYVTSGDISNVVKDQPFSFFPLSILMYNFLLRLNKKYNSYRINKGKEYYLLLKGFRNIMYNKITIDKFFTELKSDLIDIATKKECEGIICGHQTHSGIYHFGGITFLSSGYWTETLTALAESNYGKWEVIDFEKIVNDKIEVMQYADFVEELFEEENKIIPLSVEN